MQINELLRSSQLMQEDAISMPLNNSGRKQWRRHILSFYADAMPTKLITITPVDRFQILPKYFKLCLKKKYTLFESQARKKAVIQNEKEFASNSNEIHEKHGSRNHRAKWTPRVYHPRINLHQRLLTGCFLLSFRFRLVAPLLLQVASSMQKN